MLECDMFYDLTIMLTIEFIAAPVLGTLDDFRNAPLPKCTLVIGKIYKSPNRIRLKFANDMYKVGKYLKRKLHGYIRRLSMTELEFMIATEDDGTNETTKCLGKLWECLVGHTFWDLGNDVAVEFNTTKRIELLRENFRIVRNGENDVNFSNDLLDIDTSSDVFSVVSSIH